MKSKIKVALAVATALMSGCASTQVKPCQITGVTITILPSEKVSGYCDMLTMNPLNDDGQMLAVGETTLGCASKKKREIVASENDSTMKHEMAHLLSYFCDTGKEVR